MTKMKDFHDDRRTPDRHPTTSVPQYSDFGHALYLARRIASKDDDTAELKEVIGRLGDNDRKKIVFRIQGEVLEDKAKVPGIFAVAYAAKMPPVAHYTAAVKRAMRDGGLTLDDLRELGLAEITTSPDKKWVGLRYTLGYNNLRKAVDILRSRKENYEAKAVEDPEAAHKAAEIIKAIAALEYTLRETEKRRMLNKARREAKEEVAPAATDESVELEASDNPLIEEATGEALVMAAPTSDDEAVGKVNAITTNDLATKADGKKRGSRRRDRNTEAAETTD